MDTVQFGRWFSERRRAHGWQSQRALAHAARQDAILRDYGISEDFLARLEAGQLVHPFRGAVRQRVLMLTWLLCKTQRDIRTYLRAAELTELSANEMKQIHRLGEHLAALHAPASSIPMILPSRPIRLIGQDQALRDLSQILHGQDIAVYAVTGMPGIGKSTLVNEAVHRLIANEHERLRLFPDGIATFAGTGRHGKDGLISLLQEIISVFRPLTTSTARSNVTSTKDNPLLLMSAQGVIAHIMDSTRAALSSKRILLLIDNLEADFPLRQALEVLLGDSNGGQDNRQEIRRDEMEMARERCVVLFTSRYIPSPALVPHRLQVQALTPEDACELFAQLIGQHHFSETERSYVEQICAAIGYLPLAIEVAATAIVAKGIPLRLLAACVTKNPLDRLLDGEQEIYLMLERAFQSLGPQMQQEFALLSALGTTSFGLDAAAAIRMQPANTGLTGPQLKFDVMKEALETRELVVAHPNGSGRKPTRPLPEVYNDLLVGEAHDLDSLTLKTPGHVESLNTNDNMLTNLANTASELGQFVRHSLLELKQDENPSPCCDNHIDIQEGNREEVTTIASTRYWMHPLLRAYAEEQAKHLPAGVVHMAQRNMQSFALACIEKYGKDTHLLDREYGLLLGALRQSWYQEQYGHVVHILSAILPLKDCLDLQEGEQFIEWGLLAGQKLRNRFAIARFLGFLGALRYHHGDIRGAREALMKSVEIAETLEHPAHLWRFLGDLSHVAHILGENDSARHFAEMYLQRARQTNDNWLLSEALFFRAFYARIQGDRDLAFQDLSTCTQFLSQSKMNKPGNSIFEMQIQAELARVQGDYARSLEFSEAAISLLTCARGSYFIADILYDQACFALEKGILDDADTLARRAADMATKIGAHHFRANSMKLLQKL